MVLAACESEEEKAGELLWLETHATWLRQFLQYFQPHFAKDLSELRSRLGSEFSNNKRYSDSQLVGMVLFAWHLRDSAALGEAMPSAIEAIFPCFFSQTSVVQGQSVLKASKSLLRNAQLGVDVALMLVRRERLANLGIAARYGWADSSAVAQSDWLICKRQAVLEDRSEDLWGAWRDLVLSKPGNKQDVDPEIAKERLALTKKLVAGVRIYTQPLRPLD